MDPYMTHPTSAQQAKDFTAAGTLSGFSGGAAGHLTPPSSEKDGLSQQAIKNGVQNGVQNGQSQGGNAVQQGNGVTPATPATPAATPGAGTGVSGIVPTLQ